MKSKLLSNAQRNTAQLSFLTAAVCFMSFMLSFLVMEPSGVQGMTYYLERDNYLLLTEHRYSFLVGALFLAMAGFWSLYKFYKNA